MERKWAVAAAAAATLAVVALSRPRRAVRAGDPGWPSRLELQQALKRHPKPLVVVNLEAFDENADRFAAAARQSGKTIRLASKSVRVPDLLRRCQQRHPDVYVGLLVYSAREAEALFELGFDDFLVAYPGSQQCDVEAAHRVASRGGTVRLMVDCAEHVLRLDALWSQLEAEQGQEQGQGQGARRARKLPVCVDVDMSLGARGGPLRLGAHRSPCRSATDVREVAVAVAASRWLRLEGAMGYEAQVAGLPDGGPFASRAFSWAVRLLKHLSTAEARRRRRATREALWDYGCDGEALVLNGGGTGSVRASAADPSVTEITIGSGLLQPTLMDHFGHDGGALGRPAFAFALPVTRTCAGGAVACCQGGGFVASGPAGADREPQLFLPGPAEARTLPDEGFGEVQTPLALAEPGALRIGDVAFFRPAKAGEIAERFNDYALLSLSVELAWSVTGTAKTYRGLGWAFH